MSSQSNSDEKLPFIHRFVTNWLVTDVDLVNKYRHGNASSQKKVHNGRTIKAYKNQKHKDINKVYFLGGRLRSAKSRPYNVVTGVLAIVPAVFFWIYEASWLWHHISPSIPILFSYCWAISFVSFVRCCVSDPGVLPRNIHLPASTTNHEIKHAPDEYFNTITLPYFESEYNGVDVKYCATCHIWRPPRASHCGVCNSCCQNHDHHCVFLNNCVGYRTYRHFLWFLLSAVVTLLFLMIVSLVHLLYYRVSSHTAINSLKESVQTYPATLFLLIYGCLAFCYPFLLLVFHIFLTSCNITTREYLNYVFNTRGKARNKTSKPHDAYVNVFDTGSICNNLLINWLGRAKGVALLKATEYASDHDIRSIRMDPLKSFSV